MFTYTFDPAIRYRPQDEWHLKPESVEAQILVAKCLDAYNNFADNYRQILNFQDLTSIAVVYEAAHKTGIFELAEQTRKAFFSNDIHFYGVSYLWDMCMESCIYCPAALENRKKTKYKPLALSIEEAIKDICYVMEDGHRHVCILTGEDPIGHPPQRLAEYISAFDTLGLKEIILNVEPPSDWHAFELWRAAACNTALQFRVFQETYNRKKYAEIHPITKYGRKHDFDVRYFSQECAIKCGFDNVGLGVLLGNYHLPIEELDALQFHAMDLKDKTGKWPARICLPTAKYLTTIAVKIPFSFANRVHYHFSQIIYALARLAMPMISIVSSERDAPDLLAELDKYATCTTLNVHPGVGDNIRHHEKKAYNQLHFEQAPSFSRDPDSTIANMKSRGYKPLLAI